MAERKRTGQWKPGQSGNPAGRPRKERALTNILVQAAKGKFAYIDEEGKTRTTTREEFIAEMVVQALTTGQITFPATANGNAEPVTIRLENSDWMKLLSFYTQRVEGTATKAKELEEEEPDEQELIDMDALRERRWAQSRDQIDEMLDQLEENNEEDEDDTEQME